MNARFQRKEKLVERNQFVRLFDNPYVKRSKNIQFFWLPNTLDHARLGITLKGKVSSVVRVRLKRIIREWFRKNKGRISTIDLNVVLVISRPLNSKDNFFDELSKTLNDWTPFLCN